MDHHTGTIPIDQYKAMVRAMSPLDFQNEFDMEIYLNSDPEEINGLKKGVTFYYFLGNKLTGWGMPKMHSSIHSNLFKELEFDYFYPHDLINWLTKDTDLGILAHVSTLVTLIKDFPVIDDSFHIYHDSKRATPELLAYLGKAGAKSREPIKDYTQKCINYANGRGFNFRMPNLEHHFF